MEIYYSYMDTDIDKWKNLSFTKPEKPDDEWYWNFDIWEINSIEHLLEVCGDVSEIDNWHDFWEELETLYIEGKISWHDN